MRLALGAMRPNTPTLIPRPLDTLRIFYKVEEMLLFSFELFSILATRSLLRWSCRTASLVGLWNKTVNLSTSSPGVRCGQKSKSWREEPGLYRSFNQGVLFAASGSS
jgi:hypothetical protein